MANELVRRNTLPEVYDENDNISSALWWAIDRARNPHPDVGRPREFHPAVQQDAQVRLNRIASLCVPAGPDIVALWATPLLMGLSKATEADSAAARMKLVILALQDLAVGAFTPAAQAHVARTVHYTPMPADLYEALLPRSVELRQRLEHLRYIADAPTERPHPPLNSVVPIR